MHYPKSKVYFDGSHYIAIPHTKQPWKSKKREVKKDKNEEKVKEILDSKKDKVKSEKIKETVEEIDKDIKDIEKSKEIVKKVLDKEKRNQIVRLTRLYRKVNLQQWTHFCTFTYDSEKLSEEEFKKKLLNCLRHLSSRKGWKYIGVWERSPINQRLHFHGIFVIPKMIDEIIETKDYSTKTHKMQITYQNTFFLDRFGRNDFKEIEHSSLVYQAISYILKYIRKTGERVVYSKHLQTYFISDILESDIVRTIGQEDRKLLLFDDFLCIDEGVVMGKVSPKVISEMPKSN